MSRLTAIELGAQLELFFQDDVSPGSIFWKPRGADLFNNLIRLMRVLYNEYGYQEVVTPNIADKELWKISGHWGKYRENMFILMQDRYVESDDESDEPDESDNSDETEEDKSNRKLFAMKAMNCISGDALISLANNASLKLIQLEDNEYDILGYDSNKEGLVETHRNTFLDQGRKKCIELMFLDGRKLICTPDHQILTPSGWIEAQNLIIGETKVYAGVQPPLITKIYDPNWILEHKSGKYGYAFRMDDEVNYQKSLAFARICGLAITDGSIQKIKYGYAGEIYIGHEIDLKTLEKDMILVGGKCDHRYRADRNLWCVRIPPGLVHVIAELFGYGNRMDSDETFPNFIIDENLPIDFLRQFLSGMFGGDGWAPVLSGNKFVEIYLALSKSENKLNVMKKYFEQMVILMTRAGVGGCTIDGPYKNQKGTKYHYRIKIPMSSINDFAKYISFAHNCHKAQRLTIVDSYYSLKNIIIDQNLRFKERCKELTDYPNKAMTIANAHKTAEKEFRKREYIHSENYSIATPGSISSYLINGTSLRNIGGKGFYSPKEYLEETNSLEYFTNKYAVPRGTVIPMFELKVIAKKKVGLKKVYDISVDDNIQSFLANGIVVHNCPLHCVIFNKMRVHSKDMPIRMAEFGVLHRNELSGALHGLTRVRRFQQDDAHIFCRFDQIQKEVFDNLKMIERVYSLFDLKFVCELSTRPDKYIGSIEVWDEAEAQLKKAIAQYIGKSESKVKIKEGDGAFYGPKIDISLFDSLKRKIQCGTIQLDFNLPSEERFNLKYLDEADESAVHQPVIVHRAVLGSLERFIGIALEHTQGKLPLGITPYPISIITVMPEFEKDAKIVRDLIHSELAKVGVHIRIDEDYSSDDIRQKIKRKEKMKYALILTIGLKEAEQIAISHNEGFDGVANRGAQIAVRQNKKVSTMNLGDIIDQIRNAYNLY